ncbi:glutamine synthetase guanido kinase [Lactarius pseudohatsudake]|nr:glutamine synthetase guanido kinase [Lactarius pseudohatsudake]
MPVGWFEEKLPIQKQVGKGALDIMPLCSRGLLRGIVNKGHTLGVEFLPVGTVNDATWSASCAFSPGSDAARCLEDIANPLQTGEIELLMYHSESAPGQAGQYEVITCPLQAASAVTFSRETIVNIAAKHGLRATFAPRVHTDSTGTAAHSHISIRPTAVTAQPPATPSSKSKYQQGHNDDATGTIHHMIASGIASGHVERTLAGGEDNKDVVIHLTGPPGPHHLEVRTIDGTTNPHIALVTVLGLGLVGVQKGLELKIRAADRPAASSHYWDVPLKRRLSLLTQANLSQSLINLGLRSVLPAKGICSSHEGTQRSRAPH